VDDLKFDPGLLEALESKPDPTERQLAVFIHLAADPTGDQISLLQRAGVTDLGAGSLIATGVVSPQDIDVLSDQSWVTALTLSAPLNPLSPSKANCAPH
jgi:hypothetical protein